MNPSFRAIKEKTAKRCLILGCAAFFLLWACSACDNQYEGTGYETSIHPDIDKARYLSSFARQCIMQEYPNKPGHVLGDSSYLESPRELHPAFYGCYDWHSSVHGHWTLVRLLTAFPELDSADMILRRLSANITADNIQKELKYFDDEHNRSFERTYGWAWLLKLDEALREWDHPKAREMQTALQPLSDSISVWMIDFLDKLDYPIRVGEHSNSAFALSFAYDYASKYHVELAEKIVQRSRDYYLQDRTCPMSWEPSGFDFLSPCLQEASLMMKVLTEKEFKDWIKKFLPGFLDNPGEIIQPARVSDRSDGKLAHLDGLNFSRAWCMYEIGYALGKPLLIQNADEHFFYSYRAMDSGEYAGTHWLASFATYAMFSSLPPPE